MAFQSAAKDRYGSVKEFLAIYRQSTDFDRGEMLASLRRVADDIYIP